MWLIPFAARGLAISSDRQRMLDVVPKNIHDRSGMFMRSENEVKKALEIFERHVRLEGAKG